VATIEARDAPTAIHEYCIAMQWYAASYDHNAALVQGVGHFRAVPDPAGGAGVEFVVQRQDPMRPDSRELTWSDVALVTASDGAAAIRMYMDGMGWAHAPVFDHVASVSGLGSFRAVLAEHADALRTTPAPD
jgi:hypothetical protein